MKIICQWFNKNQWFYQNVHCVIVKKKKKFIKEQEQEACGLLNDLGIKTPLRWIPLVGLLLF